MVEELQSAHRQAPDGADETPVYGEPAPPPRPSSSSAPAVLALLEGPRRTCRKVFFDVSVDRQRSVEATQIHNIDKE